VGLSTAAHVDAEPGYQLTYFGVMDVELPAGASTGGLPRGLFLHSVHLQLGTWWGVQP
jgi:hypothetical protein